MLFSFLRALRIPLEHLVGRRVLDPVAAVVAAAAAAGLAFVAALA
jgi:hypothetical protein